MKPNATRDAIPLDVTETNPQEGLCRDLTTIDFSKLGTKEIIAKTKELISNYSLNEIKQIMDSISSIFDEAYKREYESAKAVFIENGGEGDFIYPKDVVDEFMKICREYKNMKIDLLKQTEEEKEQNLIIKLALIDELKVLSDKDEALSLTFQELKAIQEKWKNTGMVPQSRVSDLLETYHLYLENFYRNVKIDKALRDYDLKHNLDTKVALCAEAKKLSESDDVVGAFKALQALHSEWKEIGPVPFDKKESIWEEFKSYTTLINDAYHNIFESIRGEQEDNLKLKEELCIKVEEIAGETYTVASQWNDQTVIVMNLQEQWKQIGTVTLKDRNKIYKRFRSACDTFFEAKRAFYKSLHVSQEDNLAKKIALCERVEALKDSEDWKVTTDKVIACQKEWKTIGTAPKKFSDKVWKRFRVACDAFFENKNAKLGNIDKEYAENLEKKRALIKELKNFALSGDAETDIKSLRTFQHSWTEIGFVPINEKVAIQNEFRAIVNSLFEQLNINENDKELERFKSKLSSFGSGENNSNAFKIVSERDRLVTKIRALEQDINTWENNMGFISKSKKTQCLIDDLYSKIEASKQRLKLTRTKLKALDELI